MEESRLHFPYDDGGEEVEAEDLMGQRVELH
jgi:hypothetical protein